MWIARVALLGSVVLGVGCAKDGGVIVLGSGGGNGETTSTTPTEGGGGTGETTTPTASTGGGGDGTTTMSTGGEGGTMTTSLTGGGGTETTTTLVLDADLDGWSTADGDCCDGAASPCSDKPWFVNPGALEVPGNQVDDDCNPATLDNQPFPTCSTAAQAIMDLEMGTIGTTKVVKAMDLCQFAAEDSPLPEKTWGVISAQYKLADGSAAGMPKNVQVGVLPDFGPHVKAQYGETLVAISSGTARREGDPGFTHPKSGPGPGQAGSFNAETASSAPPSYLAAHGGELPSQCALCDGPTCTTAHDSVALRLRIRPPTNANGFSYRFDFYSSEYPQFTCQQYNDFFLTLISGDSLSPQIPADGNVAFDVSGEPISVNNLLFDVCMPSPGYPCQGGTLELVGNGWGGWNGSVTDGGATGWLQNDVPLAEKPNPADPGGDPIPDADVFELQITIWDGGDHNVDSLALLDRFRWSLEPVTLGTHE